MDFNTFRKNMIQEQLVARDITDTNVLAAFLKVSRHKFVLPQEQESSYSDFPLPIGCGQTISQPYMAALMTQCLKLNGSEKVLEIGTGSGYQTAILAELADEVYTVEKFPELSLKAQRLLSELNYNNICFKAGDGSIGWQENAPYDAIIVTAGAPDVPKSLIGQLAEGGRLVIPVGDQLSQALKVCVKKQGKLECADICGCSFVPLTGREGWKQV